MHRELLEPDRTCEAGQLQPEHVKGSFPPLQDGAFHCLKGVLCVVVFYYKSLY